jgi:HSP20 family protein
MFELTPFNSGDQGENNGFSDLINQIGKSIMQGFNSSLLSFGTDVVDEGDKYILNIQLPDFNKEDIIVEVENNTLTIKTNQNMLIDETTDNYFNGVMKFGSFMRSFDVSSIKVEEITGRYENGALTLILPKKDILDCYKRTINID